MKIKNLFVSNAIGGRWAISLKAGLYSLPILIISSPLIETNGEINSAFYRWTLASVGSVIFPGIAEYIFHKTWFKNRVTSPLSLMSVISMGAILGFLRGFGLIILVLLLGIDSGASFTDHIVRLINSTFIGALIIPALSIFMTYKNWYEDSRSQLVTKILHQESQNNKNNAIQDALVSPEISDLEDRINKVLYDARTKFFQASKEEKIEQWDELARILRETAKDSVRPLSHSIYEPTFKQDSKYSRFSSLLGVAKFSPLLISIFYAFTTFRSTFTILLMPWSLINYFASVIVLFLITSAMQEVLNRYKKPAWQSFVGFLVLTTLICQSAMAIIERLSGAPTNALSFLLGFIWIFILISTSSFFGAFLRMRSNEEELLKTLLKKEQVSELVMELQNRQSARSIAKYLHATVQSRLMASALAIEQAGRSGNRDEYLKQVDTAQGHLYFDSSKIVAKQFSNFGEIEDELQKNWGWLIDLSFANFPFMDLEPNDLLEIHHVLEEAISNSYRHGKATKIEVLITGDENVLEILVSDNGQGLANYNPGLGIEYFNLVAGNDWKLSNNIGLPGAQLNLTYKF